MKVLKELEMKVNQAFWMVQSARSESERKAMTQKYAELYRTYKVQKMLVLQ